MFAQDRMGLVDFISEWAWKSLSTTFALKIAQLIAGKLISTYLGKWALTLTILNAVTGVVQ